VVEFRLDQLKDGMTYADAEAVLRAAKHETIVARTQ
jgi:hypothetical protein